MQRDRQDRDEPLNSGDLFNGPRGFASHRSMMSSILGGRDPFDDPFFNRPFGSVFESNIFDQHGSFDNLPHPNASSSKGLVIEEIDTDDDDDGDEGEKGKNSDSGVKGTKPHRGSSSGKGPLIKHPDDEDEDDGHLTEKVKRDIQLDDKYNKIEGSKPQTHSVSFKKVTYGGINGTYYTATTTRKSGSDGLVLEDSKEADKTTGRATHRVSKGIHDKGHSVTRKLGTDGKVDTMQTLHNLNEDELAGFDEAWKGTADRHIPGWDEDFNFFGSMRPLGLALDHSRVNSSAQNSSSGGRRKKVVTINID